MNLVRVKKVDKPEAKFCINNTLFYCPACGIRHTVDKRFKLEMKDELPTITPTCKFKYLNADGVEVICQVKVEEGKLIYGSECTHKFAGKTVLMKDVDYAPVLKGHYLGEDSFKKKDGGVKYA
jgi:hypothetical protein